MGLTLQADISVLAVFLQGIFSFFSPCVLPMAPLYIGYLAGGTHQTDAEGRIRYPRGKVMLHTLFFVIGVSFAFFLLGFGFTAMGRFFSGHRMAFARIGGALVVLFGLYQIGFYDSKLLGSEHRLPFRLDRLVMSPLVALLFGFTFSFAWTPCIGPALASVLLLASSASAAGIGFGLIGVYTLGFVLPFLVFGLFGGTLLELLKRHRNIVKYTVKISGALLILIGIMMFTGLMNGVTGYLSQAAGGAAASDSAPTAEQPADDAPSGTADAETDAAAQDTKHELPDAPGFTLNDQFNNSHTLSGYKGKVILLNFWTTWCGYCKEEMPDLEAVYKELGENRDEVVILGVANPRTDENPNNQDVTEKEIIQFMQDSGYTYPVVMDKTGEVFGNYGITSFPTTFMIDRDGKVFGYVTGMLTREQMDSIIQQTKDGKRT
ncbi:MAG: cytochrome c biogenesis protein CcdA [Intestinibacillus sp.]